MRDRHFAYLVALIFAFFSLILFFQSDVFEDFKSDIKLNHYYCYADKNSAEHQYSKDCQSFLYKVVDDPVAAFTGGLFAFTIALAIATVRLFQVTKAGIAEQAELTRASLRHAEASALTAVKTLSIERAWVCFNGCQFDEIEDMTIEYVKVGVVFKATPRFINTGRSPCIIESVFSEGRASPMDADKVDIFTSGDVPNENSITIRGPGQEISAKPTYFSGKDFVNIKERKLGVVVYASVRYIPIVAEQQAAHTEICFRYYYGGDIKAPDGSIRPYFVGSPVGTQNSAS